MLHRLADGHEELEPLFRCEPGLVAEPRQRRAVDQLHDEERLTRRCEAAVEHLGDVGMVHHRQRLPLLLESLEHGFRVHPGDDQLERDPALDRLGLLGGPDLSHAAFADFLPERVTTRDDDAGLVVRRHVGGGGYYPRARGVVEAEVRTGKARAGIHGLGRGPVEEIARLFVSRQQCKGGHQEFGPTCARLLEEGSALFQRSGQSFIEQRFFVHGAAPWASNYEVNSSSMRRKGIAGARHLVDILHFLEPPSYPDTCEQAIPGNESELWGMCGQPPFDAATRGPWRRRPAGG